MNNTNAGRITPPTVPVLEIFGPTIQGEGSVIGRKTMFVRTAGCDSRCVWCDSAFTWDGSAKERIRHMAPAEVVTELRNIGGDRFDHVTISGGNPALLGNGMMGLIALLQRDHIRVGLETQGTKWQDWLPMVNDLTFSPKPPSAINGGYDADTFENIVRRLGDVGHQGHSIKVVVFDNEDYEWAAQVHKRFPWTPFYLQVGNTQPKRDTTGMADLDALRVLMMDSLEWLVDKVIADPRMNDVKVLPQLHALLWGNKQGV